MRPACTQSIVCSWCEAHMGTKADCTTPGITHSICEHCALTVFRIQFIDQKEPGHD
jgi:hypothetical protein